MAPIMAMPQLRFNPDTKFEIFSSKPRANITKTIPQSPIASKIVFFSGKIPMFTAIAPKIISQRTSTVLVFVERIFATITMANMIDV
jgi:hypothetical protein